MEMTKVTNPLLAYKSQKISELLWKYLGILYSNIRNELKAKKKVLLPLSSTGDGGVFYFP